MEEIRLLNAPEVKEYLEIAANAFPMIKMNTPEEKEMFYQGIIKSMETGFSTGAYGYFRDCQLIGGIRLFDFPMNMFGQTIILGGLGLVAVHLAFKKEKVASRMIQYYFDHYHAKGVFLLGLYPFRLDFYKKMGFGFGNKARQYQISPAQLPKGSSKKSVHLLNSGERRLILDYNRHYMETHHGFIQLSEFEAERIFAENKKVAGYLKNGRLEGYMTFFFQPDSRQKYQIHVTELLYNNREVLSELLCFLNSQSDQVEKIILDTHDEYFHFLSDNPANGEQAIFLHHQTNVEEIGIMYRVINSRLLFESLKDHSFGGVTLPLKLTIHDSFFPKNNDSFVIQFENGKPRISDTENCPLTIEMDIADFSSLVMGVVPFSRLYQYCKAEISDTKFLPVIDSLFATPQKPECYTRF